MKKHMLERMVRENVLTACYNLIEPALEYILYTYISTEGTCVNPLPLPFCIYFLSTSP